MKSMTGFGRSTGAELDIAVRSVNGRYLEIRFHLPREYSGLESELKSALSATFSRGTLDVYINRVRATAVPEVKVNTELAREWFEAYRELGSALNPTAEPTLDLLARIPEVLKVEERAEVTEDEKKLLKKLLLEAAGACERERIREGKALEADLSSLCTRLEALGEQIQDLEEDANAELQKRYRDRLQKLGFEGNVDDQRIAQEIVIQLDRTDISEELARLKEHIKAYRELLKSGESQGKKLDFYAQELLREVNTIGSKSHIARLTGLVVEAKTLIEKIREQVQNVE